VLERRPRYLSDQDRHRDRWLFSYTDIITILMVLFIAVAAHAAHEHKLPSAAVSPVNLGSVAHPRSSNSSAALARVQDVLERHGIQQRTDARGLVISLPQVILFRSGDDRINPDAYPIVKEIALAVGDLPNKIQLIGHADAIPIHNQRFHNNWELSAARGFQLLQILTKEEGIAESRLAVISYGSQDPRGSNATQDGRTENRRVEIVIVEEPEPVISGEVDRDPRDAR
jgi:chemotaxis protein MotB